jgi:hypothetical protein
MPRVAIRPNFAAGRQRMLFEGQYLFNDTTGSAYDVSPDGRRFLMIQPTKADKPATQLDVVLNWAEELKRSSNKN